MQVGTSHFLVKVMKELPFPSCYATEIEACFINV